MDAGIEIHAQIVLCPGINDGEELDRTLVYCEEHPLITSLGIVPLGFTKHQNRFTTSYSDDPAAARAVIEQVRPYQQRAFERFGRHTFRCRMSSTSTPVSRCPKPHVRRVPPVLRRHRHDPQLPGRHCGTSQRISAPALPCAMRSSKRAARLLSYPAPLPPTRSADSWRARRWVAPSQPSKTAISVET